MPIKHLSKSQINLYMDCSLKYKFQYVDMLPKASSHRVWLLVRRSIPHWSGSIRNGSRDILFHWRMFPRFWKPIGTDRRRTGN